MSAALHFVTFLSFAVMMAPYGEADQRLPAPQNVFYYWIDKFVVNVSWTWPKPNTLPQNCVVKFEIRQKDKPVTRVEHKNFIEQYVIEDFTSNILELSIYSKLETDCKGWNESEPVKQQIKPPKEYAELVRDFKCFYLSNNISCSWIPVDPSEDLKVSYRFAGKMEEDIQSLKVCEPYKMKGRNDCYLERETSRETLVLVETETRMNTFKPKIAIYVPELSINETEAYLKLTWTKPVVGERCTWRYCLWYKECGNKSLLCYDINEKPTVDIPYKKCCGYEFQYNISTDNNYCPEISSVTSKVIPYGTTRSCISTANVVAIIFPIIICFCVTLSFYCFKKHKKIFGCNKFDPSIIKEFLNINSNKENLYMPQQGEHTDTCTELISTQEQPILTK
ncbi:uncharacterized protein FYW61_019212 [Anableps anableps]